MFGSETISQSWLDRATKTVTQVVDVPTSTENQISISVNGQLLSMSSVNSVVQTYGYDGLGRRTTGVDPRIGTSKTHYNDKGQIDWVEDTHGVRTSYTYDPETGLLIHKSTSAVGDSVFDIRYSHDPQGRIMRQWGNSTYPVAYDYDEFGQKTYMHTFRGGNGWDGETWQGDSALADTTEWVYDPTTGLLTDKLYADGKGPSYTYWPGGKLKTRTWARSVGGQSLTTTYSYFDTGELQTTEYTDNTETIFYTYDRMGQQATVVDAQGTRTFIYTDEGQLDTETIVDDASSFVITRSYDGQGRSDGYSTAGISPAQSIQYGYDSFGRFSTLTSSVSSVSFVVNYSYVPNSSLLSGYTAENSQVSGFKLQVSKSYEPDRNLIVGITNQIVGGSNAGVVSSFTYMNDDLGRRTRRDDVRTADISPAQSYWEYGYNSRSELTNAVRRLPDAIPVAGQSKSYLYDNIGNRRKVSGNGHETLEIYVANELNQYVARTVPSYVDVIGTATNMATVTVRDAAHTELPAPVIRQDDYFYKAYPVDNLTQAFSGDLEISAVINPVGTNDPDIVKTEVRSAFVPQTPEQFQYDDDGNLLSDGRFDYVWNGENRLISVDSTAGVSPALHAEYAYDYQGRRFSKTVDGHTTTFLWNGNHIIHEQSASSTNSYVWGNNGHLSSMFSQASGLTPQAFFYAHDANKNVTDLVDASGNGVAHYEFDPYGNTNAKTGVLADANPFRFSNEYYDPETGHVAFMLKKRGQPMNLKKRGQPMNFRKRIDSLKKGVSR